MRKAVETPVVDQTDVTLEQNGLSPTASFDKRRILKGLRYFLLFTAIGLTILFVYTSTPETVDALRRMQGQYIVIAMLLSGFDLWLGGIRNHIFIRKIKPGVSQSLCFRANIANLFMGAVTPSQSGGGPAQMFIWYRGGISIPSAISVSVINFLATLLFFLVAASFSFVVIRDRFSQEILVHLVQYGFLIFVFLFSFFIFALWRPDLLGKLVHLLARLIARTPLKAADKIERLGARAVIEINSYHATCTRFIRQEPHLLLLSLLITIVMYTNKFVLAYFIMLSLGGDGDLISVLAIQTIILFILYFFPSPGGSGIAELSIGALMATVMGSHLLPIFTLLQRFFLLYMPATMGFFVVMKELKREPGQ